MSLRELFLRYYEIQPEEQLILENRTGFLSNRFLYFSMQSDQLETIRMEQTVLAYYFIENGYHNVAQPIQNVQGEWFSNYRNHRYIVYQVAERNVDKYPSGTILARFHQLGSAYQFEPQTISSYGKWKKLWVEKINLFEEEIESQFRTNKLPPLVLDILPYIIGMSENAIQYVRETEEEETRFADVDGGSVTFLRYQNQLNEEVVWPDELCYDHPARDLAEYIRKGLLTNQKKDRINEFIRDYEAVRPISVFGWRLIYARLVFPIQLFDVIEAVLQSGNPNEYENLLLEAIENQRVYEENLKDFYETFRISKDDFALVEVDWLS